MNNEDLCKLQNLDNTTLLDTLKARYESTDIYTNCGLLLLSINPYREINLYSDYFKNAYRNHNYADENIKPHIYMIIEKCVRNAKIMGEHSIIISGESGSGKTESTKIILDYLNIHQVHQINTIIEAMGNAKTIYNNNSSRFGKLIRLQKQVKIETFLLETSRVTDQGKDEQNFHVFYYLLAGNNLQLSNSYINYKDIDIIHFNEYVKLKDAFEYVGINFDYIEELLLGILKIGSITINENGILDLDNINEISRTFEIKSSDLTEYLLYKTINAGKEKIRKRISVKDSITLRNSLARVLYSEIFDYIVNGINTFLSHETNPNYNINILDIFGFEDFQNNGLGQFCINWCNEKIYDEFIKRSFNHQRDLFMEEGILHDLSSNFSQLRMNKSNIEIIEKQLGIVDLISEESFINGSGENLVNKLRQYLKLEVYQNRFFIFDHFVGKVTYDCNDFVIKNKEHALSSLVIQCPIIQKSNSQEKCTNVVGSFRKSLISLFNILNKTEIKYIKCIKPNQTKTQLYFCRNTIEKQLKANGILQTIQLSKYLYPCSMYIDEFESRYCDIFTNTDIIGVSEVLSGVIRGKTRCFFNNKIFNKLETMKEAIMLIQRNTVVRQKRLIIELCRKSYEAEVNRLTQCVDEVSNVGNGDSTVIYNTPYAKNNSLEMFMNDKNDFDLDEINQFNNHESDFENATHTTIEIPNNKFKECFSCVTFREQRKDQEVKFAKLKQLEVENEQLKAKIRKLEIQLSILETESDDNTLTPLNTKNIFGCFIQLYAEHCPFFTNKDIPKIEMLSMAHGLYYLIIIDDTKTNYNRNISIILEEISKRIKVMEMNFSQMCFFLTNLIEFSALLHDNTHRVNEINIINLENLINIFYKKILLEFKLQIKDLLPFSVIEHQEIKELKVQTSIFKKIFTGPSIGLLINALDEIIETLGFFCIQETTIYNTIGYLLNYIDFMAFNSLLLKRNYMCLNRCAQIAYNISEITKFCSKIGYLEAGLCLSHINEAVRIGTIVSTTNFSNFDEKDAFLKQITDNPLLNPLQINGIIELFEKVPFIKLQTKGYLEKFIPEPMAINVKPENITTVERFVIPKYIPKKALISIIKVVYEEILDEEI